MALVNFKRGPLANLPTAHTEGTFYVTTDEHALYLDVDGSTRIRIGDFQEVDTLEALAQIPEAKRSTTALYYVSSINCLAKWNGTQFIQINPDTGATSVAKSGTGNVVTDISYDAQTRTLTLTMGTLPTAAEVDGKISAAIGNIDEDTVKAYVDKKTAGIASESAIEALGGRIGTLEGLVGDDPVSEQIDSAIDELNLDETYVKVGALDDDIAAAEKAGTDAMEEAKKKVASVTAADDSVVVTEGTAPTVKVQIDTTEGNALTLENGKGLRVEIPSADEYSITKDDNSGNFAAIYHLTKNGTPTGAAINIPKDMVVNSGKVETGDDGKTYIVLVLNDASNTEIKIDASNLIEYVTSGSENGDMVFINISEDHKVTATITDGTITEAKLHTEVKAKLGQSHTHENATELAKINTGDTDKWNTAATTAASNAAAIEAIDNGDELHSFGDVEGALDTIDATIEGLDEVYDAKGAADGVKTALIGEESDTEDDDTINGAKAYADGAADEALDEAKSYTDTALTWGTF